tara:strand:+ start:30 stop:185 length:156 start_codon:yes stop_codon:yes gene_type:complete
MTKSKKMEDKKWELINILSAWKSGETDLILSDIIKYIENDYIKNKLNEKTK